MRKHEVYILDQLGDPINENQKQKIQRAQSPVSN